MLRILIRNGMEGLGNSWPSLCPMALQYYTPGEGPKPTIDDSELNVLRKLALMTYNMVNAISAEPTVGGVVYFDPGEGNRPLIDDEPKTSLKKWANWMFGLTGGS